MTEPDFDPFAGPTLLRVAPTTESQREIWTACRFGGDAANRAYNESISLRLSGWLNRAAFGRAWRALADRHEALRSAISGDGTQLLFFADLDIPLTIHDILQPADAERVIDEVLQTDANFTFDLVNGPLVRASLIQVSDTVHQFVLTAHHLVCDGWSTGILLQDLGAFYSAYAQGREPVLPESDLFSQYAIEQQEFAKTTDYQAIETFWLGRFANVPPPLNLPTDAPHPTQRTFASHRQDFPVEAALVQAVRQTGLSLGCSLVTTLVATVEILLHRLTGQTDVVLGLPAAGQPVTGHDRLVGHCVNLLPLRSAPKPGLTFGEYLRQRAAELPEDVENSQLTVGRLLQKLPIPRVPGRMPLVPVVFNVDLGLADGVAFSGLDYELISNPRAFENFDLSINATGTGASLQMEWSYNAGLFRPETIASFQAQWVLILQALTTTPDAPIGAPVAPASAPETPTLQPAPSSNGVRLDYDTHRALSDFLSDTARQFPGKTALRFGKQTLTYQGLDQQSNRLARLLQAKGVQPGDRVGVALERGIELIVSLLAIMKTGAAYVPVDPRHPDDRIMYVLADADCRLLLTNIAHRSRFGRSRPTVLLEDVWPTLAGYADEPLTTPVSGEDVVYVLYTSGTTGRPKGVLVRHQSVVNVLVSVAREPGLGPDDKTITLATIAFDLATVEIYLPLLVGAELVLTDNDTARNGQLLAELIRAENLTFMQATPATWRMLRESGWRGSKSLRIISCAEALSRDLADKLLDTCAELWNFYGPTETTIYATGKQILPGNDLITIGYAIANTQIFTVDEHGQPASAGTPDRPGEIWIAGHGVSRGYLNQPDLTREKFINSPFADTVSSTLYRTGDLGRLLPNGEVQYLGRIDTQIKIRGHRIEPAEIEHHLLRQVGVQDAVVIAREDRPGDQRLVAYVVPVNGKVNGHNGHSANGNPHPLAADAVTSEQIQGWRTQLRAVLPGYMIPAEIVPMSALPVTPNGKIDRKALPAPAPVSVAEPPRILPVIPIRQPAEPVSVAPTTDEERLTGIWKGVFNQPVIGLDDDFFDLGGHSMLAVQVMTQVEKQTGRRLPLSSLFEYPTIRELARLLTPDRPAKTSKSLVPIRPQGRLVPVYVIHGGGLNLLNFQSLVACMNPEQPIYGLQARGLDGTETPLDSMEAIAASYIEEVLDQNPTGPYALAGYSFGGYVAYEMARQLVAMGREVKLVGLFDTNAQELVTNDSSLKKLARKVARQWPKLLWLIGSLQKHPAQTIRYQREYVERKVGELLRAVGLGQPPTPETVDPYLNALIEKHEIAYKNYKLEPYVGSVDLFRATDRLYFVDDFRYLGWRDYALGGVRVHDVPGDHQTLMLPPNDQILARALQQALDNR